VTRSVRKLKSRHKEIGEQPLNCGDSGRTEGDRAKPPKGLPALSPDGYLAKCGTDKSKLLRTNIWLTDMSSFAEINAVWDAWVSPGNTPARATFEAKPRGARL